MIFESGNKTLSGSYGFPQYKEIHRHKKYMGYNQMKTQQTKGNAPSLNTKNGSIQVSVFENETDDNKAYKSYVVEKSYTKDNGKTWEKMKINLMSSEVMKLITALEKAYIDSEVIVRE